MRSKIFQTIKDYAGRSSIHGIGYIFDKDLYLVDRLLWLLLVVVFGGVAATLTWDFWFQWRNEQVTKDIFVRHSFRPPLVFRVCTNSLCLQFLLSIFTNITGGDNPERHNQASARCSPPSSHDLWLWTAHEPRGEEVGTGLQRLESRQR